MDKKGLFSMCDYSLHNVKSRPAEVGDKLTTRHFDTGTIGFAAPEDANTAVCLCPGTELAFATKVRCRHLQRFFGTRIIKIINPRIIHETTAIFRQIDTNNPHAHHDALEFPGGRIVLLTCLVEGQEATVLQLPVQPAAAGETAPEQLVLAG